jgi:hypothetical protein
LLAIQLKRSRLTPATFHINNVAKAIAKVHGLDLCTDAMLISFIGLC